MKLKTPQAVMRAAAVLAAFALMADDSAPDNWPQWGHNPEHQGSISAAGQPVAAKLADLVYDPFVPQEQAFTGGSLLVHYQVPLLDGQDVFMESKSGSYSSPFNSQVWQEARLHWEEGHLVTKWSFTSDWKPEPLSFVGVWEPVFHAVLSGDSVYVPGLGGTLFKLAKGSGAVVSRINPFGGVIDPNTFVAGPLSADAAGNVYYNVIQLDPTGRAAASWLVKVRADDSTQKVSYAVLVPDAPTGPNQCEIPFPSVQLPWPPSTSATPFPSPLPCGLQRPGVNVAPAVTRNGTVYTVSRADRFGNYGYIIAVNPDLTPKWHTSLRNLLHDGCGVTVPIAATDTPTKGACRYGANLGVDPATNHAGDGVVLDQSSSSPTVLPDGSVLYGAYTRYNVARGHLLKFSSAGDFLASHDFGWDITPAVFEHDGTYSIVLKDNHYDEELGFYCNPGSAPVSRVVCAFTGLAAGPFDVIGLNANLVPEWKFRSTETRSCTRNAYGTLACVSDHPNGFEWCINAPAIDGKDKVYVESEDGYAYVIPPGHTGVFDMSSPDVSRIFLQQSLGAAYTPPSIASDGRVYAQNGGHLFVLGAGQKEEIDH
jgi:hypothetical protein